MSAKEAAVQEYRNDIDVYTKKSLNLYHQVNVSNNDVNDSSSIMRRGLDHVVAHTHCGTSWHVVECYVMA